jgi:hypothetical protein
MCHQPFENWIIDAEPLAVQDRNRLEAHLESCPQCQLLKTNLQAVNMRLSFARQTRPPEGFTQRWQAGLQQRLEDLRMQQVLQVRRFFLYLGAATVVSLALFILMVTLGGGLDQWLLDTANRLQTANQWVGDLQSLLFTLLQITPPVLPLALWITITTVFSALAMIWIVSLWRLTIKGVNS